MPPNFSATSFKERILKFDPLMENLPLFVLLLVEGLYITLEGSFKGIKLTTGLLNHHFDVNGLTWKSHWDKRQTYQKKYKKKILRKEFLCIRDKLSTMVLVLSAKTVG